MEALAAEVDVALRRFTSVELVALRSASVFHLAWFLPLALLKTRLALSRSRVSHVLCGDALVWAVVAPLTRRVPVKTAVMVHGLDLLFPNRLYQRWVGRALRQVDRVVANSAATAVAAREHGVDPIRIVIVNPGVRCAAVTQEDRIHARAELVRHLGLDAESLIVVTLGRLVGRKGVAWFVESVLPRVAADMTYLIAGDGPMREQIEAVIVRSKVGSRTRLLGGVADELRELLLRGADVCLMPNVSVPGNMEGFGLVAIEAAARGALVVASALEGLVDAVVDGATGILVEPERPDELAQLLTTLAADRERVTTLAASYQAQARALFSIDRMALQLPSAIGLE
jgi:phosphatidyl-myo-inositol dimannoside synthase